MTDKLNKRAGFNRSAMELARVPIMQELEVRGVKIVPVDVGNPGQIEGR